MGEIFMQNHGTLLHSSQFKPDVSQHEQGFFLLFPRVGGCVSLIKISRHFNSLRQSYAEWDCSLPSSGCHQALKQLKRLPTSEELQFHLPCQNTRASALHPVPHLQRASTDALHSSELRCEGMEHTQSYIFLLFLAFGTSPPSSPLSKQTARAGRRPADLQTQVYQTRFCHQLKWPN